LHDLETIISTNEAHRQHKRVINERSTKSQSYSQRNKTPELSLKLKGTSNLLVAARRFVGENIKKKIVLILEAWDVGNNIISFGSKLNNLREYLQDDFDNEEGFYKDVVITFILKVSGMTELKRKEEHLPSPT
jgi:hypothetical protein